MRLVASLYVDILFSHQIAAAESLPQGWDNAGGSVSEWVVALGAQDKLVGGMGPRVPDGMAALSAGFYASAPALTERTPSQP